MAGAFVGADLDSNNDLTWYLGAQTENPLHFAVFTGRQPQVIDGVDYRENYMAGGVGYRWYGEWTRSLFVGLENSRLIESGQTGAGGVRYSGLYSQLALLKFTGTGNFEYLASYGVDSEHLWARLRWKFYTPGELLIGPELYTSRFRGSDINGVGFVFEKIYSPFTLTAKLGMKEYNSVSTSYWGLELYRAF